MRKEPDPCYFPSLDGEPEQMMPIWREETIEATNLSSILNYCHNNRIIKYDFFMAIWSIVLHRFTDMDLLAFGVNMRPLDPGTKSTINGNIEDMLYAYEVYVSSDTQLKDLFRSIKPISRNQNYQKFNTGLFFRCGDISQNATELALSNLAVGDMNDPVRGCLCQTLNSHFNVFCGRLRYY